MGYLIKGDEVGYDTGCDCVNYSNVNVSSFEEIAKFYNNQKNEDYIKEMDRFWGFEND